MLNGIIFWIQDREVAADPLRPLAQEQSDDEYGDGDQTPLTGRWRIIRPIVISIVVDYY